MAPPAMVGCEAGLRIPPLYTQLQRQPPNETGPPMKTTRIGLFATVLAALAIASCSKSADGDAAGTGPIKIGEFASLTGKEATFGTSSHEGTLLAIDEINAAGGVLGRQLELVYEDNRSTQGESSTIAKKLISSDKVVALLGRSEEHT